MKETLRHKEAFEYYYSLGDARSYHAVAMKFKVSKSTIRNWGRAFNWQQRVEQRDIVNAKELEKKTNETIVNSKADYRKDIKTQLGILKVLLNKAVKNIKEGNFTDIIDTDALKDIINSYEKLSKLDLLMMGEATEREEIVNAEDAREKILSKLNSLASRKGKKRDNQ